MHKQRSDNGVVTRYTEVTDQPLSLLACTLLTLTSLAREPITVISGGWGSSLLDSCFTSCNYLSVVGVVGTLLSARSSTPAENVSLLFSRR